MEAKLVSFCAIVPVKPLQHGKSRLAGTLAEDERVELNRLLLKHTISILREIRELAYVLVISHDPVALAIARDFGALTIKEGSAPDLNAALKRATVIAQSYTSRGILVMPVDLPLLNREDVLAMVERAVNPPVVVIVPDRHQRGTNGLLLSPPNIMEFCFGENSFERHCEAAKQVGARLEIANLSSVTLDLDVPEDLELTRSIALAAGTN